MSRGPRLQILQEDKHVVRNTTSIFRVSPRGDDWASSYLPSKAVALDAAKQCYPDPRERRTEMMVLEFEVPSPTTKDDICNLLQIPYGRDLGIPWREIDAVTGEPTGEWDTREEEEDTWN